jgi:PAB1-binding protein PBP1
MYPPPAEKRDIQLSGRACKRNIQTGILPVRVPSAFPNPAANAICAKPLGFVRPISAIPIIRHNDGTGGEEMGPMSEKDRASSRICHPFLCEKCVLVGFSF